MYTTAELVIVGLLKYGPVVAAELKNLLSKKDVTDADIDNLITRVAALDFATTRAKAEADYNAANLSLKL
jgi:hypothetical protein